MLTLRPILIALATSATVMTVAGCGSTGGQATSTADLGGTTWCSTEEHSRVAVDRKGNVEVKEGKDVCIAFTAESGAYVTKVVWWNLTNNIHIEEWAVAIPVTDKLLQYGEVGFRGHGEDFVGVYGGGDITIDSNSRMTMSQLGVLMDGTAAGFTTELTKVDQIPDIPIPVTYPSN